MPELPEVETIRRTLSPHIIGAAVTRATLLRRDILESWAPGKRGLRRSKAGPTELLQGARIESIHRHGKNLAIVATDGRTLGVHLGMTGSLAWAAHPPEATKHVHALWTLADNAGCMYFEDARRFGGLWSYPGFADLRAHRWGPLGPDALSIDAPTLADRVSHTHRALKAVLLDQAVIAGLGNIYADEALFIARLHPLRPARDLSAEQMADLSAAIGSVLGSALVAGGSTLRDYRDANGNRGSFQARHAVYGRAGQNCLRCGRPLNSQRIAQRMTVWCPACQPL